MVIVLQQHSHDAISHAAPNLPLHATNGFEFDELGLAGAQAELNDVVSFFVAFDGQPTQLELQLFLQGVVRCQIFVEVGNTRLMLILVLINLVRRLRLRVQTLSLFAFLLAQVLQLVWAMHDCAHHNLTGH